jgi:hypothetical protein
MILQPSQPHFSSAIAQWRCGIRQGIKPEVVLQSGLVKTRIGVLGLSDTSIFHRFNRVPFEPLWPGRHRAGICPRSGHHNGKAAQALWGCWLFHRCTRTCSLPLPHLKLLLACLSRRRRTPSPLPWRSRCRGRNTAAHRYCSASS